MDDIQYFGSRFLARARALKVERIEVPGAPRLYYRTSDGFEQTFDLDKKRFNCTCGEASSYRINEQILCEHMVAVIGWEVNGVELMILNRKVGGVKMGDEDKDEEEGIDKQEDIGQCPDAEVCGKNADCEKCGEDKE